MVARPRYPDANLTLIGEGNLQAEIQNYVQRHDLSTAVCFLPPMTQKEIGQWMNSAVALWLRSAFDGMVRVVVGVMRCGLPLISTAAGEGVCGVGAVAICYTNHGTC